MCGHWVRTTSGCYLEHCKAVATQALLGLILQRFLAVIGTHQQSCRSFIYHKTSVCYQEMPLISFYLSLFSNLNPKSNSKPTPKQLHCWQTWTCTCIYYNMSIIKLCAQERVFFICKDHTMWLETSLWPIRFQEILIKMFHVVTSMINSPITSPIMKTRAMRQAAMSLIFAFRVVLSVTFTWQLQWGSSTWVRGVGITMMGPPFGIWHAWKER